MVHICSYTTQIFWYLLVQASLSHLNPRCFYFYRVFPGKFSSSPRHGAELSDSEGMPFTLSFFLRLGKRSDPKNPCKMMQNVTAWFEHGENHGENHGNFCRSSCQTIDDPVVWGATDFQTNPQGTPKNAEILCDFRQHHFQETFCCGSMLVSDGLQKASLDSI